MTGAVAAVWRGPPEAALDTPERPYPFRGPLPTRSGCSRPASPPDLPPSRCSKNRRTGRGQTPPPRSAPRRPRSCAPARSATDQPPPGSAFAYASLLLRRSLSPSKSSSRNAGPPASSSSVRPSATSAGPPGPAGRSGPPPSPRSGLVGGRSARRLGVHQHPFALLQQAVQHVGAVCPVGGGGGCGVVVVDLDCVEGLECRQFIGRRQGEVVEASGRSLYMRSAYAQRKKLGSSSPSGKKVLYPRQKQGKFVQIAQRLGLNRRLA